MGVAVIPGEKHIGVDAKGIPYMYVGGQGRGRKKLNLSPRQKAGLAQLGIRPGGKALPVSPAIAARLGIGATSPAANRNAQRGLPLAEGKPNANPLKTKQSHGEIAAKIISSHREWMRTGDHLDPVLSHARLGKLLGNGRKELLETHKQTAANKALATAVLSTIIGPAIHAKALPSDVKITFNAGGQNGGGHITVASKAGKVARVTFKSLDSISEENIAKIRTHIAKGLNRANAEAATKKTGSQLPSVNKGGPAPKATPVKVNAPVDPRDKKRLTAAKSKLTKKINKLFSGTPKEIHRDIPKKHEKYLPKDLQKRLTAARIASGRSHASSPARAKRQEVLGDVHEYFKKNPPPTEFKQATYGTVKTFKDKDEQTLHRIGGYIERKSNKRDVAMMTAAYAKKHGITAEEVHARAAEVRKAKRGK